MAPVLAVAGLIGLFVALGSVKDGFDVADKIASVVGAVVAMAGLALSWVIWRRTGPETDPQAVARRLAVTVARVEEDALRQLLGGSLGTLIDVDFTATANGAVDVPLAVINGGTPADADPAGRWSVKSIARFYRELQPGRLVITGSPGPVGGSDIDGDAGVGKTVAAVKLAWDLAREHVEHPHVPVPVRLSAPAWPGGSVDAWLTQHLTDVLRLRPREADALVTARLVLPVIDGVDEMDRAPRLRSDSRSAKLMAAVNDYEAAPVVLTCRRAQYKALRSAGAQARTVAVLTLGRVTPAQAHDYLLNRVAYNTHHRARWQTVLSILEPDHVGNREAIALRRALEIPWRLTLAAAVFQEPNASGGDLRDPAAMLTLAAARSLDGYLLDNFIAAAIHAPRRSTDRDHPPLQAARLDPDVTWRRLAVLAAHLEANTPPRRPARTVAGRVLSGTDIALDQLWPLGGVRRVRRVDRLLTAAAPVVAAAPLPALTDVSVASQVGVLLPIAPWAAMAVAGRPWPNPGPRINLRHMRTSVGYLRLAWALTIGLALGGLIGWFMFAPYFGPAAGLAYGFTAGMFSALALGLINHENIRVSDPRDVIRSDLMKWLAFGLALALAQGVGLGLALGLGFMGGLSAGLSLGLAVAPTFYIVAPAFGIGGAVALRYIAFLCCVRGRLPWRLGRFLHHCQQLGILRGAGDAWQFRHRELQHHLATRPQPPTSQ
jgi:hypothetical protein